MSKHLNRFGLVLALILSATVGAYPQALTAINGTILTGSAPSGFASQPFEYFCTAAQALCWPQIQLWDGTNQATVNSDHGLNVHIVGGSSGLPTGAATAANQEVTVAGTSATSAQGVQGVTGGVPQPQIAGPNVTTTGTINTADTGQTCSTTNWGNQTACTGTPTAGSAYQVAVSSAGYLWVQAVTTGGTPTVNFAIRISNDGGTTWFNRGIFELTNVAPFQINNIVSPNFAGWLTGGVTNVEVVATTYTGAGSTGITITQGQATPFVTSSATSSSLNGTGASAATNIQGNGTSALPVNTNLQQIANVAVGAPTAAGSSATGNIPAIQGVTGGVPVPISGSVTASFSQFAPNGNYSTPLTVGATSARTTVPSGGGSTVAVYNAGSNAAFVQLGNSSVVATAASDQVAPGGFLCFAVGANTNIAAIETAGATTINVSGGSGGCAGSGGGGGSGSNASVGTNGATIPGSSTQIGIKDLSGNLQPASASNPVPVSMANPSVGTVGSAPPASAGYLGANANGLMVGIDQAGASVAINISTAVTTQLVALSAGKVIHVTEWNAMAGGTTNLTFEYGTGTLCATGTTVLTGAYPLTAQQGAAPGGGLGPILVVPAGNALCVVNSAAVQVSGSLAYSQF